LPCQLHYRNTVHRMMMDGPVGRGIRIIRGSLQHFFSWQLYLLLFPSEDYTKLTTLTTMVHLASVPNDRDASAHIIKGLEKANFFPAEEDDVTTSVYGSSYAAQDLPKYEMPEKEMPKDVAYRMIK